MSSVSRSSCFHTKLQSPVENCFVDTTANLLPTEFVRLNCISQEDNVKNCLKDLKFNKSVQSFIFSVLNQTTIVL